MTTYRITYKYGREVLAVATRTVDDDDDLNREVQDHAAWPNASKVKIEALSAEEATL
jgi:hypothetical protein